MIETYSTLNGDEELIVGNYNVYLDPNGFIVYDKLNDYPDVAIADISLGPEYRIVKVNQKVKYEPVKPLPNSSIMIDLGRDIRLTINELGSMLIEHTDDDPNYVSYIIKLPENFVLCTVVAVEEDK